jgi:methionyl-tRNA synthetase
MYVWMDALSNYITAIGYGNEQQKNIGFEKFWQNAHHLVGKDILRFHSVYWFSFLTAAGIDVPQMVFAHGMWLDGEGRKMGKTLGNVIEPKFLKEHFQIDAVRYFVLREMVFGQDGKFSYENLIERANADLAKGLGNLSSRTLSMITKYCDGKIPDGTIHEENFIYAKRANVSPDEQELVSITSCSILKLISKTPCKNNSIFFESKKAKGKRQNQEFSSYFTFYLLPFYFLNGCAFANSSLGL